jgi:hypothetical protein
MYQLGWVDPVLPWRWLTTDASLSPVCRTELYEDLCEPQGQQEHCSEDEKLLDDSLDLMPRAKGGKKRYEGTEWQILQI